MAQKFVAYYRVSTRKQNLGLEAQRTTARNFAASRNAEILAEYSEKESGKHENLQNRQELAAALELCRREHCTLLIAKLDRLARDVEFVFHLRNAGADVVACDLPDFNTLTLGIFATMAQHERELCSQRTKAALAERKANGAKLGAHNGVSHVYTDEDRRKAWTARTEKADARENNRKAWHFIQSKMAGGDVSLVELADALNAEHYATPSGRGQWKGTQVRRILDRYNGKQ